MVFIIYILFAFIIIFSYKNLFKKKQRTYSINRFLWLYVLIFWGIVPLIQYNLKSFPWKISVSEEMALKANILILIWVLTYYTFYKVFSKKTIVQRGYTTVYHHFRISIIIIYILILLQTSILLYFFSQYGFFIFLRGESVGLSTNGNSSIHMLISQVSRAFSTFISIVLYINYQNNKSSHRFILFLISFAILLLTNFPLAIPRYMAGAFYLAFFFLFKPNFNRNNTPIMALLLMFFIVYPSLSAVRYFTSFSEFQFSGTTLQTFVSGDFDNYSTLNMSINYVEKHGITFGHQLFGVILFFIPRLWWPSKPIGSGAFMAESIGMNFTNISCPYVAEGYINFGIFGVLLFAAFLGFVVAKLDSNFYKYSKLNFIKIFYPVALGMIFFILRGDLMSSFAYTVSFIVSASLVFIIIKPFVRYKRIQN